MKQNNYILGLDLGITSVGYGIIEKDTYNIIKYGVRLFEESTADGNLSRRTTRGARRLKSRRTNRINAIKHLLINNGIIDKSYLTNDYPKFNNIYEIRVKGLHNKLSNDELANVLINIAKRRGSSLEVAIDEDDKEAEKQGSSLKKNVSELRKNNQFICEHQLEKLKSNKKLRTTENIYTLECYLEELKQILSNQNLSEELNEKIIEIISRKRGFDEGPGSEKFPTQYGSYRYEIVDGKKEIVKVNLIEEMRGKCSIYKNEPRIAKNTYTACLFNLLNDLNNIKINGNHITTEQKKDIIENIVNKKGSITFNQLEKYLNTDKEDMTGFRVDKNKKPILTSFDIFKKMIGILPANIIDNKDFIDDIVEILTKSVVIEQRKNEIEELFERNNLCIDDENLNKLVNLTKVNGYHSLSKKAMNEIIPEMMETNKNQMQIIFDNNIGKDISKTSGNDILFNDELILSPVTKRVHREALKVLNELRNEYGEFDSVVIETTRAKNSDDEKKRIEDGQKYFEEQKKKANELFEEMGKDPSAFNNNTKLKLRLYKEQDGKTIYAGLPIDLDTLLNDKNAYQIEHIIPYAISFDNSYNNKALASAKENQDKGKRSPWAYFSSGKVGELKGKITTWSEFESIVKNNKNISPQKKRNLLNQEDISLYKNMQEFVARNLNDTSYAIRSIMNTLQDFYKNNDIKTKVITVKGKLTSDFRNRVGLKKDRDLYIHHAIDALIIAGSKNQEIFNRAYQFEFLDENMCNIDTGEVIDIENSPLEDGYFCNFVSSLRNIKCVPENFSYKVDRKTNRQFADQTIYSTRRYDNEDYIIGKYKDIYGKEGEKLAQRFKDGKSKALLVYKNDINTYNKLKEIYEFYKGEKNPFAKYKEEHEIIRKYSKKGNGPEIKTLKYIDSQLGNNLDISKNYNVKNKRVVLLQTSAYRTDVYKSPEGVYKFLTIRRFHIKQYKGKNIIDKDLYKNLKEIKNIKDTDEFLFSLNRNDIINLVNTKDKESSNKFYRFIATNNDKTNTIEIKYIEKKNEKRETPTIGKNIVKFEKYNVSPTGKWSKVKKEVLKLEWK